MTSFLAGIALAFTGRCFGETRTPIRTGQTQARACIATILYAQIPVQCYGEVISLFQIKLVWIPHPMSNTLNCKQMEVHVAVP